MIKVIKICLASCLSILSLPLTAQSSFEKIYEYNSGIALISASKTIDKTNDNGYIMAGYTFNYGAGGTDYCVVKVDSLGNEEWTKTFGGTNGEESSAVLQCQDGGYIVTGHTHSFGSGGSEAFIVKMDNLGNMEWSKTVGGIGQEDAFDIVETGDNGFMIAGYTTSFNVDGMDIFLFKLDGLGNLLWSRTYGGSNNERAATIAITSDGGAIISGYTDSYGAGNRDFFLLKTDGAGFMSWFKTYGGSAYESARSVIQTVDDGYLIHGSSSSLGSGDANALLIRTNSFGVTLWAKLYGNIFNDYGTSIVECVGGDLLLSGVSKKTQIGAGYCYILRTDSLGNVDWGYTYMASVPGYGLFGPYVMEANDGGIVMAGMKYGGNTSSSMYFMKTSSNGNVGCDVLSFAPNVSSITITESSFNPFFRPVDASNTPQPLVTSPPSLDSLVCDSPACTFLIQPSSTNASCAGVCDGYATVSASLGELPYTYIWSNGDTTQSTNLLCSGNYTIAVIDSNGCVATVDVIITEPNMVYEDLQNSICEGDSIFLGGNYQFITGTYFDTLIGPNGCDSILRTSLVVNLIYSMSVVINICDGDSLYLEGSYQSTSGVHYDSLNTVFGCDSFVTTDLIVHPQPLVSFSGLDSVYCTTDVADTLLGTPIGGAFDGNGLIFGFIFDPDAAGVGTHSITYTFYDIYDCNDSETKNVTVSICTGVEVKKYPITLNIYPNPTTGKIIISGIPVGQSAHIFVYSSIGELVFNSAYNGEDIDLFQLSEGLYLVSVLIDGKSQSERIVRSK